MNSDSQEQQRADFERRLKEAKRSMSKGTLTSWIWWGIFIVFIGGMIAFVVWNIVRPLAGTKFPELKRDHVAVGTRPEYNSNPPTSGQHYEEPEEWGIYDKPLSMERLVHNLEHGGILIYYNCQNCDSLIAQLKGIAENLMRQDRKVILAPYNAMDSKIAVVSWRWYDKMEEVDEKRINRFFKDHINKAPERVL